MKITILGCGSSGGVPLIGCDCAVCTSDNPKNDRSRASILVEYDDGKRLLVDTSADLRRQCLRNNISQIDAIFYTHAHADHCMGIDDTRSLNYHHGGPLNVYSDARTVEELKARFSYIFEEYVPNKVWMKPSLIPHIIPADSLGQPYETLDGPVFTPFVQRHGKGRTLGIRIGDMAYSTDVDALDDAAFEVLIGVRLWIVDCLRYEPSATHSHLEQTLEWIKRVKPERAVLTHMAHEIEYETLKAQLPEGVEPAYDGMVLSF